MGTVIENKNERINLRVKNSAKRMIDLAAGFEGKTVSHFIISSAMERAEKTVQEHQMMTLNRENSRQFFDALVEPVRFNQKMTAAFEAHEKYVVTK